MIKKWTIVSFALLLTLSMLVSAGYAVEPTFRMKQYSGYKTFTAALYGQVRIDAVVEVTSGLAYVDQSKAKWNTQRILFPPWVISFSSNSIFAPSEYGVRWPPEIYQKSPQQLPHLFS